MGSRLKRLDFPGSGFAEYVYDALGNRTQLLDSEGGTTLYAYDAADRLTQLTTPANDIARMGSGLALPHFRGRSSEAGLHDPKIVKGRLSAKGCAES